MNREDLGRKFARLTTDAVVRRPWLWRLFRRPLRLQFEKLAPVWDAMRSPDHLAPLEAGLERIDPAPRRVLDVGTGTGAAAAAILQRFPQAEVIGVDLAPAMVAEARRQVPGARFEVADAAALPFEDGAFELVTLANMIPFFDEVARLLAPGGQLLIAFTGGAQTPIYVDRDRLVRELGARGLSHFADVEAGRGTALLARKPDLSNTPG